MKNIMKRLLGIMLVIAMVIGMVPVSGMSEVKAENSYTIYFDNSYTGNVNWGKANQTLYIYTDTGTHPNLQAMSYDSSRGLYYWTQTTSFNTVVFATVSAWPVSGSNVDFTVQTVDISINFNDYSNGTVPRYTLTGTETKDNVTKMTGTLESYTIGDDSSSGTVTSSNRTVYFNTSGNTKAAWSSNSKIYVYGYTGSNSSGIVQMTGAGSNLYSHTFDTQYESVIFLNTNTFPSRDNKSGQTTDQTVPWNEYENPTFTLTGAYDSNDGGKKEGTWSNTAGVSDTTTDVFYVDTTLVDYFNNARVGKNQTDSDVQTWNEGDKTGKDNAPYSSLNQWISGLSGYANNGVADNTNSNAPVPLYFGDLLHAKQGDGNTGALTWYWQGANVAFGSNDDNVEQTVAQGIVGKHLENGNLVTSYTDSTGNNVKVPFFNESAYENQSNYMKFYKELQFPFTATTTKGVTTYSFDSETDNVVYDYNSNTIKQSNTVIHDVKGQAGYFPFNSADPSANEKWKLNYGFGTQFTIPFTVSEDGKDINGEDIIFSFTGDDDVWVYIDGALVLDMGGAHEKAAGTINFATQKVEISTGASSAKLGNQANAGGRTASDSSTGDAEIEFGEITLSTGQTLEAAMADDTKVHTLTMYYMERGMFNSNMSISFTFSPVPSGLVVSKDIDTDGVNAGLVTAVDNADEFTFEVGATNDGESVSFDSYTLTDHSNISTAVTGVSDNKIKGVKSQKYAHSFLNDGKDAFVGGTTFSITENIEDTIFQYDTATTVWKLYDADNNYAFVKDSNGKDVKGTGPTASFTMGTDATKSYNYSVNYINKLKVGTLTLSKKWSGTDAPTDTKFEFQILLDLDGGDAAYVPQPYALAYTSSTGNSGTLSSDGKLSLAVGETVTFDKIPAGATYTITETVPVDAGWKQDSTSNLSGEIEADETSVAEVTNKAKGSLALEADKIVMDYGKNIQVDILANDGEEFVSAEYITATTDYAKVSDSNYSYKVGDTWTAEVVGFVDSAEATGSGYTPTKETNNAKYSIATNKKVAVELKGFLSEVDTVYCVVKVTSTVNSTNEKYFINELNVIPATSMYYETNFADGVFTFTSESDWRTMLDSNIDAGATTAVDGPQDDGTIGVNQTYGYDSTYANDKYLSNGSSYFVNVPAKNPNKSEELNPTTKQTVTFSFTGTGFDLISHTGAAQGAISVYIYDDATMSNCIKSITCLNKSDAGYELYQIPVVSVELDAYGTYYVEIDALRGVEYAADSSMAALNRGGEFYFDAIRIFNPIGKLSVTDKEWTDDQTVAMDAYLEDGEAYMQLIEVRQELILASTFEEDDVDTEHTGAVFIDSYYNASSGKYEGTATIEDYKAVGPEHEVYLAQGQSIAFKIQLEDANTMPESIDIGAKSADGNPVSLKATIRSIDGTYKNTVTKSINSCTAQNFDLMSETEVAVENIFSGDTGSAYVIISNTGSGILSITDLKIAFGNNNTVSLVSSWSLRSLAEVPGNSEEVVVEPDYDVKSFEFDKEQYKKGDKAVITIVTTTDVANVSVTDKKGNVVKTTLISETDNGDDTKTWELSMQMKDNGTQEFTAIAYGEDGTSGETITLSVKVTSNSKKDSNKKETNKKENTNKKGKK